MFFSSLPSFLPSVLLSPGAVAATRGAAVNYPAVGGSLRGIKVERRLQTRSETNNSARTERHHGGGVERSEVSGAAGFCFCCSGTQQRCVTAASLLRFRVFLQPNKSNSFAFRGLVAVCQSVKVISNGDGWRLITLLRPAPL